jgi:hypothetical protein
MKKSIRLFIAIAMVMVLSMSLMASASAACAHRYELVDTYHGQSNPQYRQQICTLSTTLHSHYRDVFVTDRTYECIKCGAIKHSYSYSYGSWECGLAG